MNKFLVVMALLDDKNQKLLGSIQSKIISTRPLGTQTMDIPFHISLGTYDLSQEELLVKLLNKVGQTGRPFAVKLTEFTTFANRVFYLRPKINDSLSNLAAQFNLNKTEDYPWTPHVTLYCGEEKDIITIPHNLLDLPLDGEIVGLQLGEFFPTRIIHTIMLKKGV